MKIAPKLWKKMQKSCNLRALRQNSDFFTIKLIFCVKKWFFASNDRAIAIFSPFFQFLSFFSIFWPFLINWPPKVPPWGVKTPSKKSEVVFRWSIDKAYRSEQGATPKTSETSRLLVSRGLPTTPIWRFRRSGIRPWSYWQGSRQESSRLHREIRILWGSTGVYCKIVIFEASSQARTQKPRLDKRPVIPPIPQSEGYAAPSPANWWVLL